MCSHYVPFLFYFIWATLISDKVIYCVRQSRYTNIWGRSYVQLSTQPPPSRQSAVANPAPWRIIILSDPKKARYAVIKEAYAGIRLTTASKNEAKRRMGSGGDLISDRAESDFVCERQLNGSGSYCGRKLCSNYVRKVVHGSINKF